MSSNYLLYKVRTEAEGVQWSIFRKDADFYFLRKVLIKNYPYLMVPPLPVKKKKDTEKSIKRRQHYLSRFMQAITRCEEFKSDKFLLQWLQNDDQKEFSKIMKTADKFKYVKKMENVVTPTGSVPCQMISHGAVFCSKMTDFVDSYEILYTEVIKCAKDINDKSQELAKSM